jgi:hypothetical protein
MISLGKALAGTAVAAALGLGALAASAGSASAYVVCSNGDCWHTDARYHYRPDAQTRVYPDTWYFHQDWDHGSNPWRSHHDGRGYYRNGVWITF